jgi:protein TonB
MSRAVARNRLGWAFGASAALHVLALGSLLQWPDLLRGEPSPPLPREAIVEVVMGNSAEANGAPVSPPPPAEQPAPPAPPPQPATPPPPPPEPQAEAEVPPVPPPIAETLPLLPAPDLVASAMAPSLPPIAARPPPSPPAEKPTWQTRTLLGEGTVGAAEILGDRLRPALGRQGNLPPVYPRLSSELGEQGLVVVRMQIGPDGLVSGVEVLQTSGYPRLDQAAVSAVARWRFTPAVEDGLPVASAQVLALRFRLD